VPRRGYRFVARVMPLPTDQALMVQSAPRPALNAFADAGRTELALPDRPSIAVLPFQNMSGDSKQEYFADGVVEEIITALSRFSGLFVIALNSSFYLEGPGCRREVGRPRTRCALPTRGQHSEGGEEGTHHRPAYRCCHRGSSVGRALRRYYQRRPRHAGPPDGKHCRCDCAEVGAGRDLPLAATIRKQHHRQNRPYRKVRIFI
jgi:hypothetical protein